MEHVARMKEVTMVQNLDYKTWGKNHLEYVER
jgi:hypothetical protein